MEGDRFFLMFEKKGNFHLGNFIEEYDSLLELRSIGACEIEIRKASDEDIEVGDEFELFALGLK
jgi:hypothetical protein